LGVPTFDPASFGGTSTFATDAVFDVDGSGAGDVLFRPDGSLAKNKTLWFLNHSLQKVGVAVKYIPGTATVIGVGTGQVPVLIDVAISMSAFSPKTLNAPRGSTIRWTNMDFFAHTVTADIAGSGPASDTQFPGGLTNGKQFSFHVPNDAPPGTKYFYHCRFHGSAGNGTTFGIGMTGVVIVD
jgi:plastocyanin